MYLKLSSKIFSLVLIVFFIIGCGAEISLDKPLKKLSREYESTVKIYEKKIKANPDNLDLKVKLANFYYNFRDYDKAKSLLEGIDNREAKIILAKIYTKLRQYVKAIEIFEKLEPLPKDSEYLYLYGQVLEEKNLFPQAIKIYKKIEGEFKKQAQKRLSLIRGRVEDIVPEQIKKLSTGAGNFLSRMDDEAAIYLLVDEDIRIKQDNTSVSTVHVAEKVLSERGKSLAEVEVGYDSTYERVEFDFARTITSEGKVIYAGEENIRDVSRYLNYPLYSNARAFIISMPSVDVGSVIEYKVKIYSTKLPAKGDFTYLYRLREGYPIYKATFDLIIPAARQVNFRFFNKEYLNDKSLEPQLSKAKDTKTYTISLEEISPIIPEYGMPPVAEVNPALLMSSFSTWEEIYQWWKSLYQDKLDLNQEIKDFTDQLIKDEKEKSEQAKKIYEYVARNIRYVAIEYGDGGYEPHEVNSVFANRYGDCKDQALLLVAMLRYAGFDAYPVLIPTRRAYNIDKEFPSINFNHAIAALKLGRELIYMDPTSETTSFKNIPVADQKRTVMVFFDDEYQILETPLLNNSEVIYNMDIIVNSKENADITRNLIFKGSYASAYRWYFQNTHPQVIKEDLQEKMTEIATLSELEGYEIKNIDNFDLEPMLTYKFRSEKIFNPAGKMRIVPVLDQLYLDSRYISKRQRNHPIDLDSLYSEIGKIRIVLPDNLRVKYLPQSLNLENKWFRLEVSYQKYSDYIDFYEKFTVKNRIVEPKDYQEFKKSFEDAIYLLREEIILEKR